MKRAEIGLAADVLETVPKYELTWSDASCAWTASPGFPPATDARVFAYAITASQHLEFDVIAPARQLDGLFLDLATYARTNSHHLWCELRDAAGRTLKHAYIDPATISDNASHKVLDLGGVELQTGAPYRVSLSAPTATDSDCFAAWVVPTEPGRYEVHRRLVRLKNERSFVYEKPPSLSRHGGQEALKCTLAVPKADGLLQAGAAVRTLSKAFPGQHFDVLALEDPTRFWPVLSQSDVVVICDVFDPLDGSVDFDSVCFELFRRGVCTIFLDTADTAPEDLDISAEYMGSLRSVVRKRRSTRRRCQYVLFGGPEPRLIGSDHPEADIRSDACPVVGTASALRTLVAETKAARWPRVAIVSVLYRKAAVIDAFLEHVIRQNYPGEITVVLVDDQSPENEAAIARLHELSLRARGVENRAVVTISNAQNEGNCASRMRGIEAHDADIYIVMDCDCLINQDFVAAHVFEHARPGVDVVIGPLNIESGERSGAELVADLERRPEQVLEVSEPQDPIQQDGFLNCITRNFSVKRRRVLEAPLFDVDFSYSAKPDSGFGWEDVEMGYRLYARGAVIRFTERAFSVHCSHLSSAEEGKKIRGSMRNFELMFEKHPELELVARRWAVDTFDKLNAWAKSARVDGGEVQRALERRFSAALEERRALIPLYRRGARRLRVLSYRWHVPHQYELYKLPHDFTLLTGIGENGMIDQWSYEQRPLRPNVRLVPASQIDPRDFDLAVLHFDENVLAPNLCNGVISASWGDPFRWFLALSEIPKVAICHGTPQFVGQYGLDPNRRTQFPLHGRERQALVDSLARADVKVVCNSWQALEEWGFHDGRVIWHGFDPQEFPKGTHTRHVLSLEPDQHRPHYRGAWEHMEVESRLEPSIRVEHADHGGAAIDPRNTNAFAVRNFRSYVDRIRQFTIYLNTTLRSPMPRSRGEAMMTGVIPVCMNNHDVERFIENGVSGFYSSEPGELADWINFTMRKPEHAERASAAARLTALDVFNHDRYLTAWTQLINDTI